MTKGTKLLPLLIHIQHSNLKTNTNANTPHNDNDSTKSMKEWDADSVSTIRVYIENLLDDPSFSSLPHLWFIIIIIIIIIIVVIIIIVIIIVRLFYMKLELHQGRGGEASKVFYRALSACPGYKLLWMFGLGFIRSGIIIIILIIILIIIIRS